MNYSPNLFTLNNKIMILFLLFFYLLIESMATNSTDDSISYDLSNKIICYYEGNRGIDDSSLDNVDPKNIPRQCDFILYSSLKIDQSSMIDVDEKFLKSVTDLKIPVIVILKRTEFYSGWTAILSENGNANDTKILCDFAIKNNIQGYDLFHTTPAYGEVVDTNVGKYIIAYIKQLKELCPFLIIGSGISTEKFDLNNTNINYFEELNKVITYYDVDALILNSCNPTLYNGETPISKSEPGDNYLYGLEEVVLNLKKTKISLTKISITIPVLTNENKNNSYPSYSHMCKGGFDNSSWCVQTSKNYYDKGIYLRDLKVGVTVSGLDWDDYDNTCKCQSAFNGFYNVHAGYTGGSVIPCTKFDVQSTIYPIK